MPRQPFQDHPSEHPGSWAKPWSADEMLDGQHQRMDVLAHATTAHDGLSLNGTGRGSLLNHPSAPADEQLGDFGRVIRDLDSGLKGCGSNPRSCSDPSTARPISPASLPVAFLPVGPDSLFNSGMGVHFYLSPSSWWICCKIIILGSKHQQTNCQIIIQTPLSLQGPQ